LFKVFCDTFTSPEEANANAEKAEALWNAADGMTTEEAVRYLEYGREMVEIANEWLAHGPNGSFRSRLRNILTKLEGKQ
jgi:hypothetical protein